ncbi:MAG: MinD/ParA family protein [Deltaproteobacteria bacterium]|jgi:flagellar biosynthesis protein FlhG|nr:MinD/ParA family protein [Deltaproteobacteria bacterium]
MSDNTTLSIAVLSGKGGVGKSNLALNISFALNLKGARVLLIDCDFGLANLDVLLGITPPKTIQNILDSNLKPADVLVPVNTSAGRSFDLLPASSGVAGSFDEQRKAPALLTKKISALARRYDYVILDVGAGISPTVLNFASMALMRVLVITPEPTSLTDSYALVKVLSAGRGIRDYLVLVNQIENAKQETQAFKRLSAACTHFLNISPVFLGGIPDDNNMQEAVRRQTPLLREFPESKSVKHIFAVAEKLNKLRASMLARIAALDPLTPVPK